MSTRSHAPPPICGKIGFGCRYVIVNGAESGGTHCGGSPAKAAFAMRQARLAHRIATAVFRTRKGRRRVRSAPTAGITNLASIFALSRIEPWASTRTTATCRASSHRWRCGSDASICEPHRGMPDWRSPSHAIRRSPARGLASDAGEDTNARRETRSAQPAHGGRLCAWAV